MFCFSSGTVFLVAPNLLYFLFLMCDAYRKKVIIIIAVVPHSLHLTVQESWDVVLFWTVAAILYPVITPLHIISTVRGCPRHDEDSEEETDNQGKFMKLFEQIGKVTLIFTLPTLLSTYLLMTFQERPYPS